MGPEQILSFLLLFLYFLSYLLNKMVLKRQKKEREQNGDGKWI